MITSVKIPDELYREAMVKAASRGIYSFSELVRGLLDSYTSTQEASLRKVKE